jgi:hypothetical protein
LDDEPAEDGGDWAARWDEAFKLAKQEGQPVHPGVVYKLTGPPGGPYRIKDTGQRVSQDFLGRLSRQIGDDEARVRPGPKTASEIRDEQERSM